MRGLALRRGGLRPNVGAMIDGPPFRTSGALYPRSPVVISVAHAGRDYPEALLDIARVPIDTLRVLEDSHVDALTTVAAAEGATTVIASVARAVIDLNRDPREIDRMMVDNIDGARVLIDTQKVRGGLGLIPRRLAGRGELWRRRLTMAEIDRRIDQIHAPFHRAVATALDAARATFGVAILIDCHSMPPLAARGAVQPRIILGDRFGKAAAPRAIQAALAVLARSGLGVGRNTPYAGGYTLDRHGDPAAHIHAIQIEYDRSLYLDEQGAHRAAGVALCGRILADLAADLAAEMTRYMPIAAE